MMIVGCLLVKKATLLGTPAAADVSMLAIGRMLITPPFYVHALIPILDKPGSTYRVDYHHPKTA